MKLIIIVIIKTASKYVVNTLRARECLDINFSLVDSYAFSMALHGKINIYAINIPAKNVS